MASGASLSPLTRTAFSRRGMTQGHLRLLLSALLTRAQMLHGTVWNTGSILHHSVLACNLGGAIATLIQCPAHLSHGYACRHHKATPLEPQSVMHPGEPQFLRLSRRQGHQLAQPSTKRFTPLTKALRKPLLHFAAGNTPMDTCISRIPDISDVSNPGHMTGSRPSGSLAPAAMGRASAGGCWIRARCDS